MAVRAAPGEGTSLSPRSVAVVLGTRPEVVKLAEIIRLLGPAARVIHSGQHFDDELAAVFFEELGVEHPDVQLAVGGASRGAQIGEATRSLDEHFADDPPRAVVVQGDTNTVLAGALAANARDIPLVHIEAGLRSFDRAMPEEHNRVLTDHLSDRCCAPTEVNRANLAAEGISGDRVAVTGNTVVEAVARTVPPPAVRATVLERFGLEPSRYVLSTLHRPENVDDGERLARIVAELARLSVPVVLPLHPRTSTRALSFGVTFDGIVTGPPLGYRDFLALAAECAVLVTDSGGIQEEASVLKRPVVVVRNSTERPEVLGTFAELVGPDGIAAVAQPWLEDVPSVHAALAEVPSPYGDGSASRRSVEVITALVAA